MDIFLLTFYRFIYESVRIISNENSCQKQHKLQQYTVRCGLLALCAQAGLVLIES